MMQEQPLYRVKICCAWCSCFIKWASFDSAHPHLVSHGICNLCFEEFKKETLSDETSIT